MAVKYWFKWKGTRSDDKSIIMNAAPQLIKPEERIQHVTIPGRSGELTVTEGDNIYNSYIHTIPIAVQSIQLTREAEVWLRGEGDLILCNQPTRYQKARVIGSAQFEKHSRNLNWWEADVQFYCDPIKHSTAETEIEITESGYSLNNPGDMACYPLIEVTGSGAVTVTAGGNTLTFTDLETGWIIDSENEWVTDDEGTPLGGVCSGKFPYLKKGNNTVRFTGSVTKLTVTPRFRYI